MMDQHLSPTPPPAPLDQVRLLIADTEDEIFSDTELTNFLFMNRDSVKRAAADALDTIASSEALISKKLTTQDRSTDGPAVADALRKHADALRARAKEEEDTTEDDPFAMVFPTGRR